MRDKGLTTTANFDQTILSTQRNMDGRSTRPISEPVTWAEGRIEWRRIEQEATKALQKTRTLLFITH